MAWLARSILWLASRLNDAWALGLSRRLGALMRWLNVDAVRTTKTNLETCMPELAPPRLQALARDSVNNMVLLFVEFARTAHWPEPRLLGQITEIHGETLLRDACDSGRGVLLLVPHYGNWELFCAYLGANYPFCALYDPPKIAAFESTIVAARQRLGAEMFPIDTGGMRGFFRALKHGQLVAILPDQVPERDAGVYADFFGHPALTMTLVHRLIKKYQPVVLLGSMARRIDESGLSYQIHIEALPEDVSGADAEAVAVSMNRGIERIIERAPEHYQWEYKRFKRPPEQVGKRNIYRRQ